MHSTTFEYLKPTDDQMDKMAKARDAASIYAGALLVYVPEGPDRTYLLRQLREVAMWANIAITRNADGSPRSP